MPRSSLEGLGLFDENLYPLHQEDLGYDFRTARTVQWLPDIGVYQAGVRGDRVVHGKENGGSKLQEAMLKKRNTNDFTSSLLTHGTIKAWRYLTSKWSLCHVKPQFATPWNVSVGLGYGRSMKSAAPGHRRDCPRRTRGSTPPLTRAFF